MDALDKQIKESYSDVQRKEKILTHIGHIRDKLAAEREKARLLEGQLETLGMNLREIQGFRLEKIKSLLWGDKHRDQVEEVKLDYFVKFMFYKTLSKEIELYQFEISVLEGQLEKLNGANLRLKQLLLKKEAQLFDRHPEARPRLLEIQDQLLLQYTLLKEIEEAIPFGEKALNLMDNLIHRLETALRAGPFSIQKKGERSSRAKVEFSEQIRSDLEQLYHWLQRFNLELEDISIRFKINYYDRLKHFKQMADSFHDLSFNSYVFFNILDNGLVKLKRVDQEIRSTLTALKADIEKAENSIAQSEQEKASLIIQNSKKD